MIFEKNSFLAAQKLLDLPLSESLSLRGIV
jgi:hypothetical protein